MTSYRQKTKDTPHFTDNLSSNAENVSNTFELNEAERDIDKFESSKQTLIEECTSWKKQCNDLILQKQAIEMRSDMLLADSRREIEDKDKELKRLRETINTVSSNNSSVNLLDNQSNAIDLLNSKKALQSKDYEDQIQTLQLRIQELEDWNEDFQESTSSITIKSATQDHSDLQSNIDLLTSRNSQLENDLQRIQLQQRNNQLALERLDEYEETIAQLQEEVDQLRSKKKKSIVSSEEETISQMTKEFERETAMLRDQLDNKDQQIGIEIIERENLQKQIDILSQLQINQIDAEKEVNIREILERQIIELNEEVQSLENENYQLQEQLQSRDRQIQTFQMTPGSPPDTQNPDCEAQTLNSLYHQFTTLLPSELATSDKTHLPLSDRFVDLAEQFSTYIGTFSIIQEELDSLKQILHEKQDELEKLRSHLELTQIHEKQSLFNRDKSFDSDEDELEEILGFEQRASSQQSLLSFTPGEKQQLNAQNELLSALLSEKEQELIELQQAEKTRENLIENLQLLRMNLEQMEVDREAKQVELHDIRNVLDEKLRENSSLKKEKMFFIDKLAHFERERQEQQAISPIPSTLDREKSPSSIKIPPIEQNIEQPITQEQYETLRSEYDQLLELSGRQHDESVSYYNEYIRIFALYNELTTKYSQLQIDHDSIQSLFQQKNEAYLQCQNELNTYQNLLYHQKKKTDDIDLLRSTLDERERKLEQLIEIEKQLLLKQSELERNLKSFEAKNLKLIANEPLFEQIQLDLKRIAHERDLAIVEKKQLELKLTKLSESEECQGNLMKDLVHLEKSFEDQQSEQVLTTELETLKFEYAKLEELNVNRNEQMKYLENNLEHFQQERDCRINEHLVQYQDSLREQISIIARLTNENNELRQRLDEEINKLQLEINGKNEQITQSNEHLQSTNNSRVEKQLVKNILLSYFHTPVDKQQEVVPLLGALVGFSQEEYRKAMNAIANNYNNTTGSSWLTGWLGATTSKSRTSSETPVYHPDKSFAELLIQYVDQQSTDNLPEPMMKLTTDNSSVSTSETSTQLIS